MYARPQSEECQDRADGSVSAGQSKKVGATVGTTAAPCVLSPAFRGEGGWELTTQPAQLSTERIVPGGTKKRFENL
jgi:hypothetical protein